MLVLAALGFTPYEPSANWTYYVEAERGGAWPTCSYRFLSYTASGSTVDLWDAVGANQEVIFMAHENLLVALCQHRTLGSV